MDQISSITLKPRAVLMTIMVLYSEGKTNPSSIILPNIGSDADYQVTNPDYSESVARSIRYYTITFSAAGLFVLFCMIWITTAQYFKARKALRAVIIPYDDEELSDDDDNDSDDDSDDDDNDVNRDNDINDDNNDKNDNVDNGTEETEKEEEKEEDIKPPVVMADSSSQYEDLVVQEAEMLTWKKKLRVKRRKLISTQPLTAYNGGAGIGMGKSLPYTMNLPDESILNSSYQQSPPARYATPLKGTSLEVVNYLERSKVNSTPKDSYPLSFNTPVKELNDTDRWTSPMAI